MNKWSELIPDSEITVKVTSATVDFAERFGKYLGTDDFIPNERGRNDKIEKLTTSQLRKFFGEVKRQQMSGYSETDFVLLKPKLAYAVGRAKSKKSKIEDFYYVLSHAIDKVKNEEQFKRFINIFEAIVAYHKKAESGMN